ncbi:MAG: ClpXP protease specificity-enhancing factor [Rhodocyclaceae bacterium]|nr:ClpXP protease specificity-enhancing factor [Rhodocyclaceae bacterium]
MASTKPYLLRAIYEWCVDEGFTPYLAVQVDAGTRVPREFVRDGQIVLNIGPEATSQLLMGNEEITFQTRFRGNIFPVVVPVGAVVAIYARENGQGMAFEPTPALAAEAAAEEVAEPKVGADGTASAPEAPPAESARRGGHLTRIK